MSGTPRKADPAIPGSRGLPHEDRPMGGQRAARQGPGAGERLLSVPEVATRLGVGERHIWTLIGSGALTSLRIGRRRLVDPRDIEDFISVRRDGGAP